MTDANRLAELREQYCQFLESSARNAFLRAGPVQAYVRKSVRFVTVEGQPNAAKHATDLVSIEVQEASRGQGLGGALVELVHALNPCPLTFIESVLNPRFADFLIRQGWSVMAGSSDFAPHFVRETGRPVSHSRPGSPWVLDEKVSSA